MYLTFLTLNLVLSISLASSDTDCLQKITWSNNNDYVLEVSAAYSYIECFSNCIKNGKCIAHTWYGDGQNTKLQNICVMFSNINQYLEPYDCTGQLIKNRLLIIVQCT